MLIGSRLGCAALVGGVMSVFVLAGTSAQQVIPPPAVRFSGAAATGAATINRVPVQVQRPAAEGGGYKTEYRDMVVDVGWSVTSEAQKLHSAEVEAANEARSLSERIAKAESDAQREELKTALREALVRQFDAQQKRRSEEIASIEERLSKLKETLQKRGTSKDAIVGRRLDQLMGVKDELAWEETLGDPRAGANRYPMTVPRWSPGPYAPANPPPPAPSVTPPALPGVPAGPTPALPAPIGTTPVVPAAPATSARPAWPVSPSGAVPGVAPLTPEAPAPAAPAPGPTPGPAAAPSGIPLAAPGIPPQ
jgi:hypothetical protein